ncbi:MAG: N,N-dimethylformamidase beta subunit family domain-containing protein [Acidimicrobiales bacterium]
MPLHRRDRPLPLPLLVVGAVVLVALIGLVASGFWRGGANHPHAVPTTSSPTTVGGRTWTAIENDRPGSAAWLLDADGGHPSRKGEIEGYVGAVSAQQGDTVMLYVSTVAPAWTVTAFRMGWYQGRQARQVWASPMQTGVVQPAPTRDPATNMIETRWTSPLSISIGNDWPPGDYLFKLVSSTKAASWVPLTVRDDASHAPILVNNSVTTWQAYNLWGGYSLYAGPGGGGSRSDVVSFDRPYALGDGSGDFLGNEQKFVKLVEEQGLDVSYTTDIDLHAHSELLTQHRALVSLGHDEYWSTAMRDGVSAARDRGVNLLFLGANAVYRHIRLDPSPLGANRHEVNYRVAGNDPLHGVNDAEVTVQWRDAPVSRPENTLLGEMYECNPVNADFVVREPDAWVFAGTGLHAGDHIGHLVGSEYDHWSPTAGGPPAEDMARSPVVCRGRSSTSDFTYYVAPGGAGVIDTGTNLWVPNILELSTTGAFVAKITTTILHEAAMGPLGKLHPALVTTTASGTGGAPPSSGE